MRELYLIQYYFDLVKAWFAYYATFLYENFREFAFVIKVASVLLTVCIVMMLFCVISMLLRSWKRSRVNKTNKKIADRFGEGIEHVLSAEAKPNMTRREILEALDIKESENPASLLKDDKERLALCRLAYGHRVKDNAVVGRKRNLHVLLGLFGIQDYLEQVINKGKSQQKAEALHMMRAFKFNLNPWLANQLMNSKRIRLRRLAQYASIMSNSNTDLEYFESDFFDDNCCTYDEIQLGYVLYRRRKAKRKIPNLAHWAFMQKNEKTQCVFVRLMRQFNQREYCEELDELFQHNADKELVEEVSRTWGYLGYAEAEDKLIEALLTQSDDIKVPIMHAITRLQTGNGLTALVDAYTHSGDPTVRYEALRCIYNYGDEGRAKHAELELAAKTPAEKNLFEFFRNPITREKVPLSDDDFYRPMFGETIFTT